MEKVLADILHFATRAHGTQRRKYRDEMYINHPVRVMELCSGYDNRTEVAAAALLHDVLEDTAVSEFQMHAFLNTLLNEDQVKHIMEMVRDLTDVYTKKQYPVLNRSQRKQKELQRIARTCAASQTIKYADIIDNTNDIVLYAPSFAPRYLRECYNILKTATKGNPRLYERAFEQVQHELAKLKQVPKNR